jgi:hypothetical protein
VVLASSILLGLAGTATATVSSEIRDRLALARAGSAYAAKMLCSAVLMAGMDDGRLWREELSLARGHVKARILPDRGEVVTEALWGTVTARARRQANRGCSLHQEGNPPVALPAQARPASSDPSDVSTPWLLGPSSPSAPPREIDQRALQAALEESFQEPDAQKPQRTRAVVVVKNGWVVAERYAPGITAATPLIGWSVTKSVTHALIGIAVQESLLDLNATVPVPEWTSSGDPRRSITLDQLLRMSSGLAFSEVYDDFSSDVVTMLLHTPDSGAYAANKPLEAKPGTVWHYSSGTTNLLSRGLRLALADDEAYWRFPYERLFQPLGMHSAVLETDPSGTFMGSSLAYATARDWARFGLLYLQDGRWGERRLLPEGWVEHATTPTPGSDQKYGAHWGLNRGGRYPDIPRDAFYARGFGGQLVLVVPSRDTVIVRLGQTPGDGFDVNAFAAKVLKAF